MKFVFCFVPVALRRPRVRWKDEQVDAELRPARRISEARRVRVLARLIEGCRVARNPSALGRRECRSCS